MNGIISKTGEAIDQIGINRLHKETRGGRAVIKARRAKGRKRLAV